MFESTAFGVCAKAELHDRRRQHQHGRVAIFEEDMPAGARSYQPAEKPRIDDAANGGTCSIENCGCQRAGLKRK
jgi:hypothetical protein